MRHNRESVFESPIGRWPVAWRAILVGYVLLSLMLLSVILAGLCDSDSGEATSASRGMRERVAGRAGPTISPVERLLSTSVGPFNGMGTMQPAFTTKSRDWDVEWNRRKPEDQRALEAERLGERLGLLAWIQQGAERSPYDRDSFPLPVDLSSQPITREFVNAEGGLRIRSLISARCVDCHGAGGRMERATNVPLDSHERLLPYVTAPPSTRMTLGEWARHASGTGMPCLMILTATALLFARTGLGKPFSLILSILPLSGFGLGIACAMLSRWQPDSFPGMVVGFASAFLGVVVQSIACLIVLIQSFNARGGIQPIRDRDGAIPP